MKAMSRRLCLAILLAMFASLIAACGGGSSGGTAATSAPAAGGTAATSAPAAGGTAATSAPAAGGGSANAGACSDAGKGQSITMWSPLTGPDGDEMTQLANQFSKENQLGITVKHTAQPDYLQKLNTAAAGNSLPEMTVIRAGDIGEMVARNVLKPMSDAALTEAGGADKLKPEFTPAVWAAGEVKGKRYTVPLDTHPLVLYYNKDMFQKAGVTMPTDRPMTKDEFEKAVDALNKNGVAGVALGTLFQTSTFFMMLTRQFGGDVVNADGTEATFNSPQAIQAAQYIHDLKAKTTPQINGAGDPEVKFFQQQKAAMVFHGPWHISDMVKLPFVGYAQMPQIGSTYSVWGNSHQLSMTTEDPAKQAAAGCWIGWLSQNSVQWAKAGQVPARKSARESSDLATVAPQVAAFAKEIEAVKFLPPVAGLEGALWGQGFEPALNAYLLGQSSDIKAGLDQAVAKSNQIIKDNAAKYK